MIVKILTHLYLEKWENFWKNQGISSVKKSGNPDRLPHFPTERCPCPLVPLAFTLRFCYFRNGLGCHASSKCC